MEFAHRPGLSLGLVLCYILADLSGSVSVMCVRRAAVLLDRLEDLGEIKFKCVCVSVCLGNVP